MCTNGGTQQTWTWNLSLPELGKKKGEKKKKEKKGGWGGGGGGTV